MDIITIECPFCSKPVKAFHKSALVRERKKSSWGGSKKSYTKDREIFEVIEDCPNCGKSKNEIEKALKEGKQPSHDEVIRRLREAGLDPSKLK